MIDTLLRRTALAAIAAASLSLPAAAQSDAAFAAALGKLPSGLATMARLKTQSQRPAAAAAATPVKGPTAPADAWKKILDMVKRDGMKGGDKDFFTQSLNGAAHDPEFGTVNHGIIVSYFVATDNKFSIAAVELNLEKSTLKSGTIRTEFWSILARSFGTAADVTFQERIDVAGNEPTLSAPVAVDLSDPRVKARFDEMINFWSAR